MPAEAGAYDQVRLKLVEVGEQGQTITEAELRELFGIGHGDLLEVLNALREEGTAVNVLPSEWRAARPDELPGDEDEGEPADVEAALDHFDGVEGRPSRTERPAVHPSARSAASLSFGGGTVVLTKAVARALDAQTLGAIVTAGIEDAGDEAFILRVEQ